MAGWIGYHPDTADHAIGSGILARYAARGCRTELLLSRRIQKAARHRVQMRIADAETASVAPYGSCFMRALDGVDMAAVERRHLRIG